MNVVMLGNFRVGYSTENDLAWTFMRLGHELRTFQEDEISTDQILDYCKENKPGLLLYIHTHGWQTGGGLTLDQLWMELDDIGVTTASFHLDYWRGLDREPDVGNHAFWRTKYVFTADGGSNQWYRGKGINHFWLPPGVVERDCYYASPRDEYQHDVIFVGSYQYHPEWPYRPQLIQWLQDTYGNSFALYGPQGRGIIRQDELNRLYASAKVVVGDSLCLGFNHPEYWSDRIPETIGRGGFLVHPYIEGLREAYPDLTTYKFGDFDDLKEKIDHHIDDYADREQLRLNNHLQVKAQHTYTNRIEQMLETINREETVS